MGRESRRGIFAADRGTTKPRRSWALVKLIVCVYDVAMLVSTIRCMASLSVKSHAPGRISHEGYAS
jgi:hypothetical protein